MKTGLKYQLIEALQNVLPILEKLEEVDEEYKDGWYQYTPTTKVWTIIKHQLTALIKSIKEVTR